MYGEAEGLNHAAAECRNADIESGRKKFRVQNDASLASIDNSRTHGGITCDWELSGLVLLNQKNGWIRSIM